MTGGDFPWIFAQTYEHLLLVHWKVPRDLLRPVVPAGMDLAAFDGETWIGHDVYRGARAHVRGLPAVPGFDVRPVVTLRTIVDVRGVRGIYLISMDAPGAFAGWFEQHLLQVRTREAKVDIVAAAGVGAGAESDRISVHSVRTNAPDVELRASYRPSGPPAAPVPGSLDHFLLGGDRMFTASAAGVMSVIDVTHGAWALAPAEVTFDVNTIPRAAGLPGPDGGDIVAVTQAAQDAYAAAPRPI
jgi:uncharacterized protein YqjF (DUF2071 family)